MAMTRLQAMTALHQLTSSNTQNDAMGMIFQYISQFDPAFMVGVNSVLTRVSQTPILITVPTALNTMNQATGGRDSYPTDSTL